MSGFFFITALQCTKIILFLNNMRKTTPTLFLWEKQKGLSIPSRITKRFDFILTLLHQSGDHSWCVI